MRIAITTPTGNIGRSLTKRPKLGLSEFWVGVEFPCRPCSGSHTATSLISPVSHLDVVGSLQRGHVKI